MANTKEYNIKINGIEQSVNGVDSLGKSMNKSTNAIKETNKQIKALQSEMVGLDKGSKQWKDLAKQAGELKDRVDDIREATRRWASDTKGLDDVINVAQSATAAFTLAKGAMSAFGMETEGAVEAIQKLQGAMAVIQSLQTLQNTLKGSSATAAIYTKTIGLMTKGMQGASLGAKALRIALASMGIGLIIGLVATLITNWEDLVGWFKKTVPWADKITAVFKGIGQAIINWVTNPIKTLANVMKKVFAGDFTGALEEAKKGLQNQFKGTVDAYKKGYSDEVLRIDEERRNKQRKAQLEDNEYQLQMLQARLGNDAKYSKEGIALQKKILAQRKQLAKGNTEELKKIALDEANFNRECQEKKAAAAKKSADEQKKAAKEAANAAKEAAREAERKRKEQEKADEEARKKAEEYAKNLYDARKKYNDLEIDSIKAKIEELKRAADEDVNASKKEIEASKERIKQLQDILKTQTLSNEHREQLLKALDKEKKKYKELDGTRVKNLEKIKELETDIVELEKEKAQSNVYDELRKNLNMLQLSDEEILHMLDGTSEKLKDFDELQVQHVKNAAKQMEKIAQEAQTKIAKIQSTDTSSGSSDTGGGKTETKKETLTDKWHKFIYGGDGNPDKLSAKATEVADAVETAFRETIDPVLNSVGTLGDAISMAMDLAIEEAEDALEEAEELHDKAVNRVEESKNKITELQNNMKNASASELEQMKTQMADEMLLMAQREAEEKRLQKEKEKREAELRAQEKKQRKLELKQQLADAIVSGALAVVNGLATKPFVPMGIAMGALAATTTAIQIATITKQISKMADGGLLSGKSHSRGGIPVGNTGIEVEGGEYVVNKRSTAKYLPLLQQINAEGARKKTVANQIGKYANGGELNYDRISSNLNTTDVNKVIQSSIAQIDLHPQVSVVDINRGQKNLTTVRQMAGASK